MASTRWSASRTRSVTGGPHRSGPTMNRSTSFRRASSLSPVPASPTTSRVALAARPVHPSRHDPVRRRGRDAPPIPHCPPHFGWHPRRRCAVLAAASLALAGCPDRGHRLGSSILHSVPRRARCSQENLRDRLISSESRPPSRARLTPDKSYLSNIVPTSGMSWSHPPSSLPTSPCTEWPFGYFGYGCPPARDSWRCRRSPSRSEDQSVTGGLHCRSAYSLISPSRKNRSRDGYFTRLVWKSLPSCRVRSDMPSLTLV